MKNNVLFYIKIQNNIQHTKFQHNVLILRTQKTHKKHLYRFKATLRILTVQYKIIYSKNLQYLIFKYNIMILKTSETMIKVQYHDLDNLR